MIKIRTAVLFTGGKDSTYALHVALLHGFDVKYLIVMKPKNEYSWMYHSPGKEIFDKFEEIVGIPTKIFETSGEKEKEVEDLRKVKEFLEKEGIRSIFAGAIRSDYQRIRINKIFRDFRVYSPLWRKNQVNYMREIARIFKTLIISVSADGLQDFIGKVIDEKNVEEIIARAKKYGFNPAFEGGEAETLVLEAPFFKKKIKPEIRIEKLDEYNYRARILSITLDS